MILDLTKKQARALQKHFAAVATAARMGRMGMLVAQVHEGFGEPYMRVGFLGYDQAVPMTGRARFDFPRLPYAFAGIPPVPTSCSNESSDNG